MQEQPAAMPYVTVLVILVLSNTVALVISLLSLKMAGLKMFEIFILFGLPYE
jgi:hypothetical protein